MGHIYLIGFMGTGKTTVSHELKRLTKYEELDMDAMIVEREGRSISDIFDADGEDFFRNAETDLLKDITRMKDAIISCGGGLVVRPVNVQLMKDSGRIVLLTARPETVLERVKDDENRPILKGNKNIAFIESLMEKRRQAYLSASDIQVATDGKGPNQIAEEILAKLHF